METIKAEIRAEIDDKLILTIYGTESEIREEKLRLESEENEPLYVIILIGA